MNLHTHVAKKPVLPMVSLRIEYADDAEVITIITREGKRAVLAVAKAHYSGPDYKWVWC